MALRCPTAHANFRSTLLIYSALSRKGQGHSSSGLKGTTCSPLLI